MSAESLAAAAATAGEPNRGNSCAAVRMREASTTVATVSASQFCVCNGARCVTTLLWSPRPLRGTACVGGAHPALTDARDEGREAVLSRDCAPQHPRQLARVDGQRRPPLRVPQQARAEARCRRRKRTARRVPRGVLRIADHGSAGPDGRRGDGARHVHDRDRRRTPARRRVTHMSCTCICICISCHRATH